MAFRYIWKDGYDFYEGMKHKLYKPVSDDKRIPVSNAEEIDQNIKKQIDELYKKYDKIGIMLSGGMDSSCLARYLKPGSNAYTFKSELAGVYADDMKRAEKYSELCKLKLNYVDISFEDYRKYTPIVMETKCAPVSSIEPQIYKAALFAKKNGDEMLIVGESADLIFGGMDQLISKDWDFDGFVERYTFLKPELVLKNPVDMSELYEKYREGNGINVLKFMDDVFAIESSSSYLNAFGAADMDYYDPYAKLIMRDSLDMERVRNGEPKYLIRDFFALMYPDLEIPFKIPMPRPVDKIFENWEGPKREEFRDDIPMNELTGNQKWQLWCSENFLDQFEK